MRFSEIIRHAIDALAANPVRTVLTGLGMAIGAATTTVVVIMGHGARDLLDERLEMAGKNLIVIRPGAFSADGFIPQARLTREDAQRLRKDATLAQLTTGIAEAQATLQTVRVRNKETYTTIDGVHHDAFSIRGWKLDAGRFLTRHDDISCAPVCVLGHTVREALFPSRSADNIVGQKIMLSSITLTVVGVLQPRGKDPLGRDHDDEVFVPLNFCQTRLTHSTDLTIMIAMARTTDDLEEARSRIRTLLREQHRVKNDQPDDCDITSVQDMAAVGLFTMSTMNLLTLLLAGSALVIGAIGVMATLLVTAGAQTREIGLRTCVGALPQDIRNQLIVESTLVTVIGGVIGIGAGLCIASVLTSFLDWPFSVSLAYPIVGIAILLVVGISSGMYPAIRAARIEPITALHAE